METQRTVAEWVWSCSWASACLVWGGPWPEGLLHPRELRTWAYLPHLKCGGGPAVFIHILGGIKLSGRPFLPFKPPRAHFFPEGIHEALTEVGCEEALRKYSHCASEE